jgi:prolipoprotein diacylglyceryltransferase
MAEDEKRKNEIEKQNRKQTELEVGTTAFLGGIAFATMVFVMQAKDDFIFQVSYYPDIIMTVLAGTSFTLIIANILNSGVASGADPLDSFGHKIADKMTQVGVMTFVIIIPFLLLPFTLYGAISIGIIEIVVLWKIFKYYANLTEDTKT